jgi:hypothetical protein
MLRLKFNGKFTHRYGHVVVGGVHISEEDMHAFAPSMDAVLKRFPDRKKGTCVASFEARDSVSLKYDELQNKKTDLIAAFNKARSDTAAAIGQYTTIDKLLEAWPEIEPFTKGVVAKRKPQLPAVPVSKLNELLGLPAEAA